MTATTRITSVSARNKRTGALEHYRSRDASASRETVLACFGAWLHSLGWGTNEILIIGVATEDEDQITQAVRNRLIKPR